MAQVPKNKQPKAPVEKWIVDPIKRFISNSTMSGVILFSSAFLALILSNSPWADEFHHLWEAEFSIRFGSTEITKTCIIG
jgi:NhaA family Na+:H+ antiporter